MAQWLHRLEGTLTRRRRDDALEEELRLHLELETDAARRTHHHHDGGRRAAHLRAGGVPQAMEALRDQRGVPSLTDMARDMRVAVRGLYGRPGFTAVALFTIALGIGANAAMFSIVHGVLLTPLPYPDAHRLVRLYQTNSAMGVTDGAVSPPDFDDWRAHTQAWDGLAASQAGPMLALGLGEPVELEMALVAGDFFGTLGTRPVIGRTITDRDVREAVPWRSSASACGATPSAAIQAFSAERCSSADAPIRLSASHRRRSGTRQRQLMYGHRARSSRA